MLCIPERLGHCEPWRLLKLTLTCPLCPTTAGASVPVPSKAPGVTFLPTCPQESPCLLSLRAKDLLLSTYCLNHDPTCNTVSALQKALSCQETNHRQVNMRKPNQGTAERPPPQGKIRAFAAFLVTVPKYPIRATEGRGWCFLTSSRCGRRGSRSWRPLVTWHPRSVRRDQWILAISLFSPFLLLI